jgi:tRNA G46 methylase TrmB
MRPGGRLYIATDVPEYADHVRSIMKESIGWKLNNEIDHLPCVNGPSYRPITKYEKKAIDLSNRIWDFEYQFN